MKRREFLKGAGAAAATGLAGYASTKIDYTALEQMFGEIIIDKVYLTDDSFRIEYKDDITFRTGWEDMPVNVMMYEPGWKQTEFEVDSVELYRESKPPEKVWEHDQRDDYNMVDIPLDSLEPGNSYIVGSILTPEEAEEPLRLTQLGFDVSPGIEGHDLYIDEDTFWYSD